MTWRSHLVFWLTVWLMALLATPLLLSIETQTRRIYAELERTSDVFGKAKAEEITSEASERYKALFINTGYLTEKNPTYTKPQNIHNKTELLDEPAKVFSKATNDYLTNLSVNVYGMLVRWGVVSHWMLFIFPFILASFIDGFVIRKIKFSEFGFISPMAYSMSLHFIIFVAFIPMLYLIAPLPITPYFMPGWALCMGLPIMLMISNTQRLLNA